ncbi:MAG: HAD-IA family hydrolase [Rhodopseudomonas palustris]|nr:HAD-IA family hydrolase [Rhodopseudomonas palustris]
MPHIFSAADVARGKPAPDLFWHAAQRMGAAPADCVVIEDSVSGILAARAAGMRLALGFCGEQPLRQRPRRAAGAGRRRSGVRRS